MPVMSKHTVQFILNAEPRSPTSTPFRLQPCGQCHKVFSRTGDLTKHHRNVHRGEKRHACKECPKRFSEKGNLNKHIKRFHTTTKDYKCSAHGCIKQFATSDALLRHGRQVHRL